jgi:hypothetical protein
MFMSAQKPLYIAAAVGVIGITAAVFFWPSQEVPQPTAEPEPVVAPVTPQPIERIPVAEPVITEPVEETTDITQAKLIAPPPSLNNSDAQVREVLEELSPDLKLWLLPEQQLRKWVATTDLMAEGSYPRKYPAIDFPLGKFEVKQDGDGYRSKDSNFNRANTLVEAITAIEPATLASYYDYWQPLLEQAYGELGKKDQFEQRLQQAIDTIIALEPLPEGARLIRPHIFYQYEDPALEQRSDLEKLIWRLGPENQAAIQAYLRELKAQLGQKN